MRARMHCNRARALARAHREVLGLGCGMRTAFVATLVACAAGSDLHEAAAKDPHKVDKLIEEGKHDIHGKNHALKRTPMHAAALHGNAGAVESLLRAGANVDAQDMDGMTPLHVAALGEDEGCVEVIHKLVGVGGAVEAIDGIMWTPLHHAAWHGRTGAISALLSHGAAVDARALGERTALHLASLNGKTEAMRLLRVAGAAVDTSDALLRTPMHHAAWHGNVEGIKLLHEEGASLESLDADGHTPIRKAHVGHDDAPHDDADRKMRHSAAVELLETLWDESQAAKDEL